MAQERAKWRRKRENEERVNKRAKDLVMGLRSDHFA
jgi:hypothetical protein